MNFLRMLYFKFLLINLEENYLTFFEDIDDVDQAMEYISDSDLLSLKNFDYSQTFPHYNSQIASRGLLYANTHPTPRKFQQLYKPKSIEVSKEAIENSKTIQFYYVDNVHLPPTSKH